jgi:hypothetical protein
VKGSGLCLVRIRASPHGTNWEQTGDELGFGSKFVFLCFVHTARQKRSPLFESLGIKFPETTQRKNHRDGKQKDIVAQKKGQKEQSP